jgi:toxin FitB
MFLLDTNVVSEAFRGSPEALAWFELPGSRPLHLSVISLGEIERGVVLAQRRDVARAAKLAKWLKGLQAEYQDRILPVDQAISLEWGKLSSKKERGDADGLIAATALVHEMTLVTRNVRDFADTGVKLINPWTET